MLCLLNNNSKCILRCDYCRWWNGWQCNGLLHWFVLVIVGSVLNLLTWKCHPALLDILDHSGRTIPHSTAGTIAPQTKTL